MRRKKSIFNLLLLFLSWHSWGRITPRGRAQWWNRYKRNRRPTGIWARPSTKEYVSGNDFAWFDNVKTERKMLEDIKTYKKWVNSYNRQGYSGLAYAVINGWIPIVKALLDAGADVNAKVRSADVLGGDTPLHLSIRNVPRINSIEIASLLLERGANPNIVNDEGDAPMHIIFKIKNYDQRMDLFRRLLVHGEDINAQNLEGLTPLHMWVNVRDKEMIRKVLKSYASMVNRGIKDTNGRTPQQYAEYLGYVGDDSVLTYLTLDYPIKGEGPMNANQKNWLGQSALALSAMRTANRFGQELLRRGARANIKDRFGKTELFYALHNRDPIWWVELLLKHGSDPTIADNNGQTPLDDIAQIADDALRTKLAHILKTP